MAKTKAPGTGVPEWIGNTPFPPEEKRVTLISRDMIVSFLYGFEGYQVENQVFASTDKIFMAEWTLPPGAHYDPAGLHLHGDEVLAVLKGTLVVRIPSEGDDPKDATYASYHIKEGEKFLIPEGVKHQYMNFTQDEVKAYVAIGPGL